MIEGNLILLGLALDIVGAVLIISPWLYFKKFTYSHLMGEVHRSLGRSNEQITRRNKQRKLMLMGFGFLITGFMLQFAGNWFLYPPI